VDVASGDERGGHPGAPAVEVDVDAGEVFGVIAQLDPAADEGRVDAVGVAFEGDGRGAGHLAGHRPPERRGQPVGVDAVVGPAPLEATDRRLVGLGMDATVGDLFGPGHEAVVELGQ
jgi:hypothetical protein